MPSGRPNLSPDDLRSIFTVFGERECRGYSPLYEQLCLGIAEDGGLLALAATAHGWPPPNVLLGAVHYLLLDGADHPLAAFYPSVARGAQASGDPMPAFRDFCRAHESALRNLLTFRLVQTNEIRRCACLLPAFCRVAAREPGRPLALIEIGPSAGLNLVWDRYAYDYGAHGRYGAADASVRLTCEWRGDQPPSIPPTLPQVGSRLGLDLNPVDLTDPAEGLWLRALVWPEHHERAQLLQDAIALARRDPPPLRRGDAVAMLPDAIAGVPDEVALCVYHSFTVNQFSGKARGRLDAVLAEAGAARPVFRISLEGFEQWPTLGLQTYTKTGTANERLAACHPHGEWIEWAPVE